MKMNGDLGVYLHIPFCKKKCPYCNFYSIPLKQNKSLKRFLNALFIEIKNKNIKKASSIYFGGGTPSLLSKNQIIEILEKINFVKTSEITLEINPENVNEDFAKNLFSTNVNRISLGVQSFNDKILKILKRGHNAEQSISAIKILSKYFENISIDLMYDIPHLKSDTFINSIEIASLLPITHLSLYNLTFEKNTFFYKKRKNLKKFILTEKESVENLKKGFQILNKKGFFQYEISAFSKKNKESFHNLKYWKAHPVLGLGPSAFSYFQGRRFKNISDINKYIFFLKKDQNIVDFEENLSYPKNIKEILAINLRILKGANIQKIQKKFGSFPKSLFLEIENLKNQNFLIEKNNILKLSEKGLFFYDFIAESII